MHVCMNMKNGRVVGCGSIRQSQGIKKCVQARSMRTNATMVKGINRCCYQYIMKFGVVSSVCCSVIFERG